MSMRKKCLIGVGLMLMAVLLVSVVIAADEANQPTQQRRRPNASARDGRRGGMFNREDFQKRINEMLKGELGATDDEWKVIEPRLTKVMTLARTANANPSRSMMSRMFRGQGPGRQNQPRPADQGNLQQQSKVEKAVSELENTLNDEKSDSSAIKAKLLALRQAREQEKQALAKAQQELRDVLTIRQEAKLVMLGMLE